MSRHTTISTQSLPHPPAHDGALVKGTAVAFNNTMGNGFSALWNSCQRFGFLGWKPVLLYLGYSDFAPAKMMNTTMIVKIAALIIALVVFVIIGIRNVSRDFHPRIRSHAELFLAGAPLGFTAMLIIIPRQPEATIFAALCGILTGIALSFSAPRQWRYWNVPKVRKRE